MGFITGSTGAGELARLSRSLKQSTGCGLLTLAKVMLSRPPWKFGSPDTGSKKSLRPSQSAGRAFKDPFKMGSVSWNAVSGRALEVRPDEFRRVELRGVRRKVEGSDPRIGLNKALDLPRLVDRASIPEKNESSPKVFEKVTEESHGLAPADVLGDVEAKVESKMPSSGRDADRRDRRDLRPVAGHLEDRSLAANAPGLSDRRDKREAAFVEKDDWNLKFPGLFLYAVKYGVSTAAPFLRLSPWPALPASDNSSPWPAGLSIRALGDRKLRNVPRSPELSEAGSKVRWNSRSLGPLSRGPLLATASGARLVSAAAPGRAWEPGLSVLRLFASDSNGEATRLNSPASLRYPPALFPDPRAGWLAGVAVRALFGFHGVSLGQYIIKTLLLRESIDSIHFFIFSKFLPWLLKNDIHR